MCKPNIVCYVKQPFHLCQHTHGLFSLFKEILKTDATLQDSPSTKANLRKLKLMYEYYYNTGRNL